MFRNLRLFLYVWDTVFHGLPFRHFQPDDFIGDGVNLTECVCKSTVPRVANHSDLYD